MAKWQVTITGKGIQRKQVQTIADAAVAKWPEKGIGINITDATPPESRADRFSLALDKVRDAHTELEALRDELQEWRDNLPDNMQDSDKASQLDDAINSLEDLMNTAEEVVDGECDFPTMMG